MRYARRLNARFNWLVALAAAFITLAGARSVWADAADVRTAGGTVNKNANGTLTVTVSGNWVWSTHKTNCSNDKRAVGFAIDWNDPTPGCGGNHVTTIGTDSIDVGVAGNSCVLNPADNTVHPTPPYPPA